MAELQEKYQERYKGRKGRKRLQEINAAIEQLRRDTGNLYDETEEMKEIDSCLPDPEVKMYFLRVFRDLDAIWSGVETFGFLRLCGKWIRFRKIEELTRENIEEMLESILPSGDLQRLREAAAPSAAQPDAKAGK